MASSPRTLRANFSWTFLANVLYSACQWGIISAFAKIGDAEMVGEFVLALAITSPIQAFFQFQLRGVQATDARKDFEDGEYFSFRAMTTAVAVIVSIGVILFGDYSGHLPLVIILMTIGKAVDSTSDVFYGAFQQRERMDVIARALIANGLISLVLSVLGLWLTQSIVVATVGYTFGSVVPLVTYVAPLARKLRNTHGNPIRWWHWTTERARALLRLSFPLGIVMLLISLNINIPRYVIDYTLGTSELGIFAALSYLLIAGSTVINAVGQSLSPRLAEYFASGQYDRLVRMLRMLVLVSLGIGVAGFALSLVLGGWILELLYTPLYREHANVLALLALGAGLMFSASICGYGLTAARKFDVQVPISLVVMLTNIAACVLLIPAFGLEGAAVSVGVTQGVYLLAYWLVLHKTINSERGKR